MCKKVLRIIIVLLLLSTAISTTHAYRQTAQGQWVAGDFHSHTWLTDGNQLQSSVTSNAFNNFGLDWMANSEHGGRFSRGPDGLLWTDPSRPVPVIFEGDPVFVGGVQAMWRWQSLSQYSWPILFGGTDGFGTLLAGLQSQYPANILVQGLEWNVPTHDHASVGIVGQTNPTAISNFEYQFDRVDGDTSKPSLIKAHTTHIDAVAAATYMQATFAGQSYIVLNHPSRALGYSISAIRDLNNAAPDVVIGLEGMPGHQKQSVRGGYSRNIYTGTTLDPDKTARARTYGGADIMLAQVGGVMDALWGEGRHFWVFVNSDFHAPTIDFWPGEYAKTYTYVTELSPAAIVAGLRSGNTFIVHGDLINALDFTAAADTTQATMGQELIVTQGNDVTVTIRFKSPATNHNGNQPVVDHIDLIMGEVTGIAEPGTTAYTVDTNPTTQVVATFTSVDMQTDVDGYQVMTYTLPQVTNNLYLRLRGTNLGMNVPNETQDGNPLVDDLMGTNNTAKAYADLWFYSNPIFVTAIEGDDEPIIEDDDEPVIEDGNEPVDQPGAPGNDAQPTITDPALSKIGTLAPGQLGLPGETITWTITATAPDHADLTNVVISDILRSELQIVDVSTTSGTATTIGQMVNVTIPFMPAGSSTTIQITTLVLSNPTTGIFTNTATLTADNGLFTSSDGSVFGVSNLPNTGYSNSKRD